MVSEMYKKRESYKDLKHISEHLENLAEVGSRDEERIHLKLARGLVKAALEKEKERVREGDKNGKRADSVT